MSSSTLAIETASPYSLWRRQVGRRLEQRRKAGPRNLAAISYIVRGNGNRQLVDVRRITVCILHDLFDQFQTPQIRFAAYRLQQIHWGIALGGPDQIVLDKDLSLAPRRRAYGRRFSRGDHRWLPLALRMDKCLDRHARHPFCPRPTELRLPKYWAALNTDRVTGNGPEFTTLCGNFGLPANMALLNCRRRYRGQVLYPLEFVSHAWRQFRFVYADIRHFFRRQVIRLDEPGQLSGHLGACSYDLMTSSFRRMAN